MIEAEESKISLSSSEHKDRDFKVICRIRPRSRYEASQPNVQNAVEFIDGTKLRYIESDQIFEFDRVFEPSTDQDTFFNTTMHEYIDALFNKTDVWIFTYGTPGSGGSYSTYGVKDNQGIIPQFLQEIFNRITPTDEELSNYSIHTSIYELYLNKLYDLSSKDRKPLKLVSQKDEKDIVMGLTYKIVSEYAEALDHLNKWLCNRNGCSTIGMNVLADRSTLIYNIKLYHPDGSSNECKIFTIWGPEKISQWGISKGEALKIATSINTAFGSLSNYINNIVKNRDTKVYRDNVLTRVLKYWFNADWKTAMILTVYSSDLYSSEILSTLKYGKKAMKISDSV